MNQKSSSRLFLLITISIALGIIPFAILGQSFEDQVRAWFQQEWSTGQRFALIVGLLAVDIGLPIPSSAVSSYGGAVLGFAPATLASWLGMTIGATIAFAIARFASPLLAGKLADDEDLQSLAHLSSQRSAYWLLILTRPLPILAEACVIFVGTIRLPWRRFLIPVIASNLLIALFWSAAGAWSIQYNLTPVIVIASAILPLILTWLVRDRIKLKQDSE